MTTKEKIGFSLFGAAVGTLLVIARQSQQQELRRKFAETATGVKAVHAISSGLQLASPND